MIVLRAVMKVKRLFDSSPCPTPGPFSALKCTKTYTGAIPNGDVHTWGFRVFCVWFL